MEFLFGTQDEAKGAAKLLDQNQMEMIVIKKASKGATFYDRERVIHAPAFKIIEIDATGAGDTFGPHSLLIRTFPFPKSR